MYVSPFVCPSTNCKIIFKSIIPLEYHQIDYWIDYWIDYSLDYRIDYSIDSRIDSRIVLIFNLDPLGSKNITIHYPGAIFGSFLKSWLPGAIFQQYYYSKLGPLDEI